MKTSAFAETIRVSLFLFLILLNTVYTADVFGEEAEEAKSSGFTVLPGIWYTPETKLAGGGQVMYYFRSEADERKSRLSSIPVGITYTQKKQIAVGMNPDLYLRANTYHLTGEMGYSKRTSSGVTPRRRSFERRIQGGNRTNQKDRYGKVRVFQGFIDR